MRECTWKSDPKHWQKAQQPREGIAGVWGCWIETGGAGRNPQEELRGDEAGGKTGMACYEQRGRAVFNIPKGAEQDAGKS